MLKKLWMDEGGATISAELALVGTILVIGVVVGLSAVQSAVVGELADLGAAIGSLDQSYSTSGYDGHTAGSAGSIFNDSTDNCDGGEGSGNYSACVSLAQPAGEGQ